MEVMVSVSIFTIIMVIGISSLLTINISNSQSRSDREAMDKVSFLLESMTRKIRTGVIDPSSTSDRLVFLNQFGNRETYTFNGPGDLEYSIEECTNPVPGVVCQNFNNADIYPIAPSDDLVEITRVSFDLFDVDPQDAGQALVIIHITGIASEKHQQTPFAIQTAVSQRQLQL